jgi:hypothetical protein
MFPSIRWEYQEDGPRRIIFGVLQLENSQLEISFEYEHYYDNTRQVRWISLGVGRADVGDRTQLAIKKLADALGGIAWNLQTMKFL